MAIYIWIRFCRRIMCEFIWYFTKHSRFWIMISPAPSSQNAFVWCISQKFFHKQFKCLSLHRRCHLFKYRFELLSPIGQIWVHFGLGLSFKLCIFIKHIPTVDNLSIPQNNVVNSQVKIDTRNGCQFIALLLWSFVYCYWLKFSWKWLNQSNRHEELLAKYYQNELIDF